MIVFLNLQFVFKAEKMSLICTCLLILISGYISLCRSTGDCSKVKSYVSNTGLIYLQEKYCCDNFQRHEDGKCYACRVGFTSKAGSNCSQCPEDQFGFRCAEICKCDNSKRCHNVHGCVPKHYFDNTSTQDSFDKKKRPHSDSNIDETATKSDLATEDSHARISNKQHRSVTTSPASKENGDNGFIGQKVLTYIFMAVAGALLVIIGLCMCLVCVCWKRHISSKKKIPAASRSTVPLPQFPVIQENVSFSEFNSGYGYEVIDDTKLEREKTVIQHDYVSVESLNNHSEVFGTDSDGYLHPYHSLISVNSISSKGVDDKNNENIDEEKSYLELFAEKEYNTEVQQNEICELINNKTVSKKEDDIMYDVPKSTKYNDDKVSVM